MKHLFYGVDAFYEVTEF